MALTRRNKTFRVCSAGNPSERYRCSGNCMKDLMSDIRTNFNYAEIDELQLRNTHDGTIIHSDYALDRQKRWEFLTVYNHSKNEKYQNSYDFTPDVSPPKRRKPAPLVVNNITTRVHNHFDHHNNFHVRKKKTRTKTQNMNNYFDKPNGVQVGKKNTMQAGNKNNDKEEQQEQ